MRVAIRSDASIDIGTGHIFRCLALANELKRQNYEIDFFCRDHPGHMGERIIKESHSLKLLQSSEVYFDQRYDWLIVDHYLLDYEWESQMRNFANKIMVIDDLMNREHDCDLLLDQTYGRKAEDYKNLTPEHTILLTGSSFALIRPEFNTCRNYSIKRRSKTELKKILISMGGVDKQNYTGNVLEILKECSLDEDTQIKVLLGASAPNVIAIKKLSSQMPWKTEVKVDCINVAKIMSECDLAIGGAGITTWERCCLGLPTIMFVLADNQRDIATALEKTQAAMIVNKLSEIKDKIKFLQKNPKKLMTYSRNSSNITDGKGCSLVSEKMNSI